MTDRQFAMCIGSVLALRVFGGVLIAWIYN